MAIAEKLAKSGNISFKESYFIDEYEREGNPEYLENCRSHLKELLPERYALFYKKEGLNERGVEVPKHYFVAPKSRNQADFYYLKKITLRSSVGQTISALVKWHQLLQESKQK